MAGDRDSKGRLQKGNKVGRGRRKGSRNKLTEAIEALAEENGANVFQTMVVAAMRGDVGAAQLVLRPFLARVGKGRPVDLGAIETAAGAVKAMAKITAAVGRGDITVAEGRDLMDMVDRTRQAIEAHSNEKRIQELEEDRREPNP